MKFLPLLRELVRSYQAFESFSVPHIRSMQLTSPQFDVIATLGNQPAMTCKDLGKKTLITKGTLTGVLDRLEIKKLIVRQTNDEDGRSQKIALTASGQSIFEQAFPSHIKHLEKAFNQLTTQEMADLTDLLKRLRDALEQPN
jgi:MarR family transcriptional regulator, 2-MHQ and catechol-resistance regulon repressor